VAVAPNKFARGFMGPDSDAPAVYEVLPLEDALLRRYNTDAHLVTYVIDGAQRQPRINKPGLPYFPRRVTVSVFFCDVDNPDHRRWDRALIDEAHRQYVELDAFKTAGIYLTAHGRRIVQPIAEPIKGSQLASTGSSSGSTDSLVAPSNSRRSRASTRRAQTTRPTSPAIQPTASGPCAACRHGDFRDVPSWECSAPSSKLPAAHSTAWSSVSRQTGMVPRT
jgi:hypothetical protein